ncbi:MAG: sulfite exporter TauE/SafE family protein [Actinomycetota bacterium]
MTPAELAVAATVVLIGSLVQGSLGFGLGLVSAPVLALVDTDLVPVTPLLLATVLSFVVAFRERDAIAGRELTWAWVGRLPGTAIGVLAVASVSGRAATTLFGAGILLAVVMTASGRRLPGGDGTLFGAGVLSGVMATAVSVGGPPIALVLIDLPPRRLRATLSAFFGIGAVLSLAALLAVGAVQGEAVRAAAILAVPMAAGLALAGPVTRRATASQLTAAALTIAGCSALLLLARGAWG